MSISETKNVKRIVDSHSEDESAALWVIKHQKLLQEEEAAEKRAKLLEEMDKEFGVSALMAEELDKKKIALEMPDMKITNEYYTPEDMVIEILNINGSGKLSQKDKGGNIEMNSVAEFCLTLGEIPTHGLSGNQNEEAGDLMDLEQELLEKRFNEIGPQNQVAWNAVDVDEKPTEIMIRENEPIFEEEPDISLGVAGALNLAMKKGFLDKEDKKHSSAPRSSQLQVQSNTIEEKFYEDDKVGKCDRYTGPIQVFKEKTNYKPHVKLEYTDDDGRLLTAKEAFRYLSHKFHGKGPGKNKVYKRMKKLDQDNRLKQMSSTDTLLKTVKLLQQKQNETQSPYIVLSGGNKTQTRT